MKKIDTKDPKQVGALGGKARWANVSKTQRSIIMKKVSKSRFIKK